MKYSLARYTIFLVAITAIMLVFTGCFSHRPHHHHHPHRGHHKMHKRVPPGHQKKMHGEKSASPFAPGQQKKRHRR